MKQNWVFLGQQSVFVQDPGDIQLAENRNLAALGDEISLPVCMFVMEEVYAVGRSLIFLAQIISGRKDLGKTTKQTR